MRQKKSIIFLDFDGVLTNEAFLRENGPVNRFTHKNGGVTFCPNNMEKLNVLCKDTGAKVVVISTWRKKLCLDELSDILYANYFTGEVIGMTDDFPFTRGAEVLDWLLRNGERERVDRFVIIDDRLDFGFLQHNLCTVHEDLGMTDETVYRAKQILSGDDTDAHDFADIRRIYEKNPYPRFKIGRSVTSAMRVMGRKDAGLIRYLPEHRSNVVTSARFAKDKHACAMNTAVHSKDYTTLRCLLDIHSPEVKDMFIEHHLERAKESEDAYLRDLLMNYVDENDEKDE